MQPKEYVMDFATQDLTGGQMNALVKNLMAHMGIIDPVEAVRRVNAGEWRVLPLSVVASSPLLLPPDTLIIDRSQPFNPAQFIGDGWSIWRGPANANGLSGDEEQDSRSLALTSVSLSAVLFDHCLRNGETSVKGETKLARLIQAGRVRLDARIGQALFEEEGQKTLEWLHKNRGISWLDLPGTILRRPLGYRCILYLYRRDGGGWDWGYDWLDDGWHARGPSGVLAS